jgi:hypothetical protein
MGVWEYGSMGVWKWNSVNGHRSSVIDPKIK